MSEPTSVDIGDALDWLHEQGKRRSAEVPGSDVEETLLMVRIADQLPALEQDQDKPGGGSPNASENARALNSGTGTASISTPNLQLELAHHVAADGTALVRLRGELDIGTADQAYAFLRDVIDSRSGPVEMNLAELTFCDAAGLGVLARVAGHAKRSGCPFRFTAMRPSLRRIMHITGMDEAFPGITASPTIDLERGHTSDPPGGAPWPGQTGERTGSAG